GPFAYWTKCSSHPTWGGATPFSDPILGAGGLVCKYFLLQLPQLTCQFVKLFDDLLIVSFDVLAGERVHAFLDLFGCHNHNGSGSQVTGNDAVRDLHRRLRRCPLSSQSSISSSFPCPMNTYIC